MKDSSVWYSAGDECLRRLHDSVFALMNGSTPGGAITRLDVPDAATARGRRVAAVVLQLGTRPMPPPDPRVEEAMVAMIRAGTEALTERRPEVGRQGAWRACRCARTGSGPAAEFG